MSNSETYQGLLEVIPTAGFAGAQPALRTQKFQRRSFLQRCPWDAEPHGIRPFRSGRVMRLQARAKLAGAGDDAAAERSCPVRAIEKTGKIVTAECFQCLDCQVEYYDDTRCPPLVIAAKLRVKEKSNA